MSYVHVNTLFCSDCDRRNGLVNGARCGTCSGTTMIHKCTKCGGNTTTLVDAKYVCCTV